MGIHLEDNRRDVTKDKDPRVPFRCNPREMGAVDDDTDRLVSIDIEDRMDLQVLQSKINTSGEEGRSHRQSNELQPNASLALANPQLIFMGKETHLP